MKNWDSAGLQKHFNLIALNAERYANELAGRIKRDPRGASLHVREMHDEHLAKFYVYDSLAYNRCLETRASLIAELKARLDGPCTLRAEGRFSAEHFEHSWRQHLTFLLKQYQIDMSTSHRDTEKK
jgi:hypothetical protein